MKLLISLATYGTKNINYINQVIDTYKSFNKYDVDIIVNGTDILERADITFIQHINPINTVYFHRSDFVKNLNSYDYYLFSEDDILITEDTIDTYIAYDKKLDLNTCLGFLRYEKTEINEDYMIDLWLNAPYPYIKNDNIIINNERYFSVTNPHQSCYVLSNEKLNFVISNSNYAIDGSNITTCILEHASSGIFTDWYQNTGVINKVIPVENLRNCIVEHLPGSHSNGPGINEQVTSEMFRNNTVTYNQLYNNLQAI
jgi:hypothetical protein